MARINYDEAAAGYAQTRHLSLDAIAAWEAATAPHLRSLHDPLLDVGAGVATFAEAFVHWFEATVIAVEPSAGMRAEAHRRLPADIAAGVCLVGGRGEALPLRSRSCGAAWLSTVLHHFADLEQAAHEIARVLTPGAPLLVRSAFPDGDTDVALFRFFPAARAALDTFPSIERTTQVLAAAGLEMEMRSVVPQVSAPSGEAFLAQARQRADTTLQQISDRAFDAGIARLERDPPEGPVVDSLDFLVFRLRTTAGG